MSFLRRNKKQAEAPPPPPQPVYEDVSAQQYSLKLAYLARSSDGLRMQADPALLQVLPTIVEPLASTPVATNQVRYNVLHKRPAANGVLEECRKQKMPLTAYSPFKDGVLQNRTVGEIARKHGATPAQIAIAWLLTQPNVITIPKTTHVGRARENLEALDIELSAEEMERLGAVT